MPRDNDEVVERPEDVERRRLEARERLWRGRTEWEIAAEMVKALERYRAQRDARRLPAKDAAA